MSVTSPIGHRRRESNWKCQAAYKILIRLLSSSLWLMQYQKSSNPSAEQETPSELEYTHRRYTYIHTAVSHSELISDKLMCTEGRKVAKLVKEKRFKPLERWATAYSPYDGDQPQFKTHFRHFEKNTHTQRDTYTHEPCVTSLTLPSLCC